MAKVPYLIHVLWLLCLGALCVNVLPWHYHAQATRRGGGGKTPVGLRGTPGWKQKGAQHKSVTNDDGNAELKGTSVDHTSHREQQEQKASKGPSTQRKTSKRRSHRGKSHGGGNVDVGGHTNKKQHGGDDVYGGHHAEDYRGGPPRTNTNRSAGGGALSMYAHELLDFVDRQRSTRNEPQIGADVRPGIGISWKPHGSVCDCPPLPPNLTRAMLREQLERRPFRLGVERDIRPDGTEHRDELATGNISNDATSSRVDQRPSLAFVVVVSNHKYIDGALVLGDSLRSHSKLLAEGAADLNIIVTEKISNTSLELLRATGYDRILVVHSLAPLSKRSYYTGTFDKLYLFWFQEYDRLAFLDADTIATDSPDQLFTYLSPSAFSFSGSMDLAAVGHRTSGYFQTGLLIVRPQQETFLALFLEYFFGTFNYNQWRARDGILVRNCYDKYHKSIQHPPFLHHYYGFFKPWFNKDKPPRRTKYAETSFEDGFLMKWWERYERLHREKFAPLAIAREAAGVEKYGGTVVPGGLFGRNSREVSLDRERGGGKLGGLDPRRFMWLQRGAKDSEYARKLSSVVELESNWTVPSMSVHFLTNSETTCSKFCFDFGEAKGTPSTCRDDLMRASSVNSCGAMRRRFAPLTVALLNMEQQSTSATGVKLSSPEVANLKRFLESWHQQQNTSNDEPQLQVDCKFSAQKYAPSFMRRGDGRVEFVYNSLMDGSLLRWDADTSTRM